MRFDRTSLARMLHEENGSVSVEYVLWTPAILLLMLLVTDASAAFIAQGAMWQSAGDVARAIATGRIGLEEASQHLSSTVGYSLAVQQQDELIAVRLSRPFDGIGTGLMLSLLGDMQVTIVQRLEPGVEL